MNYSNLYDTNTRTPNRVYLTETDTQNNKLYTKLKNVIECLYMKSRK